MVNSARIIDPLNIRLKRKSHFYSYKIIINCPTYQLKDMYII